MRFQAGPGVPTWAVGKTAQEILGLSVQMADTLASVQQPQRPAQAQPQPTGPAMPNADDYTLDPVQAAQRQLEYNYAQRVQPVMDRLQNQLAGASRGIAAQQFSTEFQKWGPEIDGMIATVPAEQRTADLYAQAVKLVKANHIDEIAEERMQAKMAGMGVTDRTGGGGSVATGTTSVVDLSKLPPGHKAAMDKVGVTPQILNEFLAKTHQTMEQFVESANRNQVITDTSWDHNGRSQSQIGNLDALYSKSVGPDGKPVTVKEW